MSPDLHASSPERVASTPSPTILSCNPIEAAALIYAERGWLVLPLHTPADNGCSCFKGAACTAVGKHPRIQGGLSSATKNQAQIRHWWRKWPHANVGILTGAECGLVVVDVDNESGKDGQSNLNSLAAELGGLPATLMATTGNGFHLFFKHPDFPVKNSVGKLARGVDIRADGGYVVAAPSIHANGKHYAWIDLNQPLADLPSGLLARITTDLNHSDRKSSVTTMTVKPTTPAVSIDEGQRNDSLFKYGCALRGQQGMDRLKISSILGEFNAMKCKPPLDSAELNSIVDSVCHHPPEMVVKKSAKRMEQHPLYWFPKNIREWFSNPNIQLMTDAQIGRRESLEAWAWQGGGFLTADYDELWKLANASSKEAFTEGRDLVLADYELVEVDGVPRLRHVILAPHFTQALDKWMKKKMAGEARNAAQPSYALRHAA